MFRIYLDHAASTPLRPEVKKVMDDVESRVFANPSSLHQEGREARVIIDEARLTVAQNLGVKTSEIIFTSNSTESNDLAIYGVTEYAKSRGVERPHVILSRIEHAGSIEFAKNLERMDTDVSWVETDTQGLVEADALLAKLRPETVLVSILQANNEIGSLNDIASLVQAVKVQRPDILFHTDASQAIGWVDFLLVDLGVDLLTASSYKLGGPKGVALLYVKTGVKVVSMLPGNQEWGKRGGTEPTALIAGFAKAFELSRDWPVERVRKLRDELVKNILQSIPGSISSTPLEDSVPHIAHFSFEHIDSQLLTIALDRAGVAASPGAACSSGAVQTSHVVEGIGIDLEKYTGHLRLSLGIETTEAQIKKASEILAEVVGQLRK